MITEQRQMLIVSELKENGLVKVTDLVEKYQASESTIRRDLIHLENLNYLKRVHGGAVSLESKVIEKSYNDKLLLNNENKKLIAKYAASLIEEGDSVYLDSGTTSYEMIRYLNQKNIMVVTNGLSHIEALIENNVSCMILGGKIKSKTKAIVGYEAIQSLNRYRFDKCFMGTNGVHHLHGFTTPDPEEAAIKENAIKASKDVYILADASKLSEVSFTRFAQIADAVIITDEQQNLEALSDKTTIKVVNA
ncbi:MAG: DeoR/GlpR family DNA-binding transcription regulator [Turicibacter sp.]